MAFYTNRHRLWAWMVTNKGDKRMINYVKHNVYLGKADDPEVIDLLKRLRDLSLRSDRHINWIYKQALLNYLNENKV